MNEKEAELLQLGRRLREIRHNTDWKKLNNDQARAILNELEEISKNEVHRANPRNTLGLLDAYNDIFNKNKTLLPDQKLLDLEFMNLKNLLNEGKAGSRTYFASKSFNLMAKWGRIDPEFNAKCLEIIKISILKEEQFWQPTIVIRFLWAYASLIPPESKQDQELLDACMDILDPVIRSEGIGPRLWGMLIPVLEYFQIYLPDGKSIDPYYEMFLAQQLELKTSNFESQVAMVLDGLKVDYMQHGRISVYAPDFVIFHNDKKLVLECEGHKYHVFPGLLRTKILSIHGYYSTSISDISFFSMNRGQRFKAFRKMLYEFKNT